MNWNDNMEDRTSDQGYVQMPLSDAFKRRVGALIREARHDLRMTQADLADSIARRQASLSDMENGKMLPDYQTLLNLSRSLKKPITYFFPDSVMSKLMPEEITWEQEQLLGQFNRITIMQYQRLAIQHVKTIADFEQEEMFKDEADASESIWPSPPGPTDDHSE